MDKSQNNPLFKHFRQPSIYLKLPSGGKFYPEGTLDLSVTGEIPIFPMTVKDEITLKTPDALINGNGMGEVIMSCCPAIKDPWSIPSVDLDAIFIAIRLASYGTGMDINTNCPKCKEANESTVNLTSLLESIPSMSLSETVDIEGMQFEFKPQTYKDINQMNMITFEERRLVDSVYDSDTTDEEKKKIFAESFTRLTKLNIGLLTNNINSVTVDGERVIDPEFIQDFLENCSRDVYNKIKQSIQTTLEKGKIPDVDVTCDSCQNQYKTSLEFDQANFFV